MADVRLTATNPADSSVVPVACNEKGELKLEEIPDQSFDGNLQGDLTVSGSATFDGGLTISRNGADRNVLVANNSSDNIGWRIYTDGAGDTTQFINNPDGGATITMVGSSGSASFDGIIQSGNNPIGGGNVGTQMRDDGGFLGCVAAADGILYRGSLKDGSVNGVITFRGNGSAEFAGNKAGFTAEGYLWCTTRRGDTVMLDVTSNGLASWVPYTPPNRLTELQDKWAEKDGILPVPHESSQDEPETPQ